MSRLFLILGDQLHPDPHPLLADFDAAHDRVLMVEAPAESTHVWSHKARSALFLAAMRHRAAAFRAAGLPLDYLRLGEHPHLELADALQASLQQGIYRAVLLLEAGDYRVQTALEAACAACDTPLLVRPDPHFLCSSDDFQTWAGERHVWRLEFFYRWQRKRHNILMAGEAPVGGQWNFDADNRQTFGRHGPGLLPPPLRFPPDETTAGAIADVERHFPDHPGETRHFAWPVTPEQARAALDDFIRHRLPEFGRWQDAMWQGQPFLWHSLLSAVLNLKLIDPRTVIAAAVDAYQAGYVPIAAAEGFIRQILGWREFVRGIYGRQMPFLAAANQYGHDTPLPALFWTGRTHAACLADSIGQTLEHGYAHHIQRLMITGNFALIAGLDPRQVADWYLAVYVDAIAWVEEPNTLGMALNAWPGMTSKPYCASGAYIKRMSNYCSGCRYRPEQRTGPTACPFTVFYWDFLLRHAERFAGNPRMTMPLKNLQRFSADEIAAISGQAERLRQDLEGALGY
nr:cryptochrome/photolyase family protein [Dechloromonas sp.]